ncbi:MAG: hypothetical protein A2672_02120 [Candidatus Wildermuthbacteria bacterium RIFCSPHIGHO2_01_FULL_49_22b]|uniref:Uncharacterized protein n=1 Tax=Candidatus Wildermuthbacteria bacterium RIFCSPHIGHO2_01_FULL_49_22b TaxID=1802448 RepID=A0A1G2QXB2_9BACT|nr:MAG: hypothetical protein A2672_02120 [Candidatus Wildermuthbacteria bacterium RIFCSPHIGHO2_01_FULL_49_22b]
MAKGQRGARWIARNRGDIGVKSDLLPTRQARLNFMEAVCRGVNPNSIASIRPAGSGVVAVMTNGTVAKIGCW